MNASLFRGVVEEVYDAIPPLVRERMVNVALLIEDEPSPEVRVEEKLGAEDTLLGHYQGVPHTERGSDYGIGATLPDIITLYRIPLLEEAKRLMKERSIAKDEAIRAAVRETLWHEIAHYVGYDEEQVHLREEEGTNTWHTP